MVTVTGKFRVTIPEKARNDLGVNIGDEIVFLRTVLGEYQVMKASEFVKQFCEESREIEQTVKEIRAGLGRAMAENANSS